MPSNGVAQPEDQPKDENLLVHMTATDKNTVEDLAEHWECSQSAALRRLIRDADREFLEDEHEEETPAAEAVADGGTASCPSNYDVQVTPAELAQSGPQLEWEELRDAVRDEAYWSDTLEIHPDRVPQSDDAVPHDWKLKANTRHTPRIIAAMCRYKAESQFGQISETTIEGYITDYLSHLTRTRKNSEGLANEEGLEYLKNEYTGHVTEILWEHPRVYNSKYCVTPNAITAVLEKNVEQHLTELEQFSSTVTLDEWREEHDLDQMAKRDWSDWYGNVIDLLQRVAELRKITLDYGDILTNNADIDYPDTYNDEVHYLVTRVNELLEEYKDVVDKQHRDIIEENVLGDEAQDILFDIS